MPSQISLTQDQIVSLRIFLRAQHDEVLEISQITFVHIAQDLL